LEGEGYASLIYKVQLFIDEEAHNSVIFGFGDVYPSLYHTELSKFLSGSWKLQKLMCSKN
jgi:hypothetical protein